MANDLQEFVVTLKEKLNIVDVVGSYVQLERRGLSYWACCPFHHEKTPSFVVNESDQFFHCFGCGASGDVIKFVREIENLEFMDALKLLADRAKLPMPQRSNDTERIAETKRKKDAILKILSASAHFYLNNLNSGKAEKHIEYILKREIPSNIVRTFGLGASLDFHTLPRHLLKMGFLRQDIIDSGAVNEVKGKLYDAQGGRLIYPIINAMNEVVAFGGRILEDGNFAKYKNTRETMVFNKSKSLYNINLLKKLRRTQNINEVIIVEGYMDTISLYQAGFKNVVASMGTSLTQEQARLAKRYANNVLISYDGDFAGQKANMRGLEILKGEGLNVKVVPLPDGMDPDDVIKKTGAEGYQKCIDGALPLIDFKLSAVRAKYDLKKTDDRRRYVAASLELIRTEESASTREELLRAVGKDTGLSYESLKSDLGGNFPEKKAVEPIRKKDASSVTDKASRFVIAAFLFSPKLCGDAKIEEIPFENPVHNIIARYIFSKREFGERVQPSELFEFFDESGEDYEELTRILDYSDGAALRGEVAEKYFRDCISSLKMIKVEKDIKRVTALVERESDPDQKRQLKIQLADLIKQKEKIRSGEKK